MIPDPVTGQPAGFACSATRAPCPCPYGWCHTCRAPVIGASTLPLSDGSAEIDLDPGPAGDGIWAVWELCDGTLACRPLRPGEQPWGREQRARAHEHQLTPEEAPDA